MGLFLGPYGGPRDLNPGPYSKKSLRGGAYMARLDSRVQGYLAHKKYRPPRTLRWAYS